MYLEKRQRMFLQIYRRAADLSDAEYHEILQSRAAVDSSKSRFWSQPGFDRVMGSIEGELFRRVQLGLVRNPIGRSRWIRKPDYWRSRCPADGEISTREIHKIDELWHQLCPFLEPRQRNAAYFSAIVAKATGRDDVGMNRLSAADANRIIEALKNRRDTARRTYA